MTSDVFREFDRYCEHNNISDDDTPKAFEAFLREYGELPDVKGRPLVEGAASPDTMGRE